MTQDGSSTPAKAPVYGVLSDQIPKNLGGYWRETVGHALQFRGALPKLIPAGTALDAPMAVTIATEAAKRFAGVDKLDLFKTGYLWEHPAFRDILSPPAPDQPTGSKYDFPGIARTPQAVELLCWPASAASFYNEWNRQTNWYGLHELDMRDEWQLNSALVESPKILDSSPFLKPENDGDFPNGWYPNAKGTTVYWRKYYTVDPWCKRLFRPLGFDEVCLAVSAVSYYYEETNDYEHRMNFAVWANIINYAGEYTYAWSKIKKYREIAERLALAMYNVINIPASPESIIARKRIWEANL